MKIVSNTTPIISLASIGQLNIFLLIAKEKNIIKSTKPLLDEMISKGRWYSKTVYLQFLERAGEM